MKKFVILFSLIVFFIASPVYAYFVDGKDLVEMMREFEIFERTEKENLSPANLVKTMQFMGFVAGVSDTMQAAKVICPNRNVTQGQACAVVVKYLNDNPEKWNTLGSTLVWDALTKAFPCKK
jgi:hypothetical protein